MQKWADPPDTLGQPSDDTLKLIEKLGSDG